MLSRRFLLLTGGAILTVVATGMRLHSDLAKARRPWVDAGNGFDDPRLNALSYAVLAPNPHNRQPWLVRLDDGLSMTLFCDLARLLPETDPPNRQITIGLGAFLELLRMAAADAGFRADITSFPDGVSETALDERPIAKITLVKDSLVQSEPLFSAVGTRRTVRTPFDFDRTVSAETLKALSTALRTPTSSFSWANDSASVDTIKQICKQAWLAEVGTERTHKESTRLMRIGESEINDNPDGISLSGPVMEGMGAIGLINRDKLNDPESLAYEETVKFYNAAIDSAMAFGWLTTDANSRDEQLNSGADWLRIHLQATALGLSMHPLSQALQEFPEVRQSYDQIHAFASVRAPGRVQGLFRFGYSAFPPPAPRWPLMSRIIDAPA